MTIDINDDLFFKVKQIVKGRNLSIYEQLKEIKPMQNNTLERARTIKTDKVKQSIKETLKELLNSSIAPTKYQIHKRSNIAYVTLNKYFDDILEEVHNEH